MKKIFIPLLLLGLWSCKKDSNPNESRNNLIPMKIGYEWIYDWKGFDQNGTVTFSMNFPDRISRTELREGKTYYQGTELYRNLDTNTVEVYRSSGKTEIYLKRVAANATLIYSDTLGHFDTSIHKLVGYTDVVNINGYDCIRNEEIYTRSGMVEHKRIYYIKPGVGLVRIESYYGNTFLYERFDLISHNL